MGRWGRMGRMGHNIFPRKSTSWKGTPRPLCGNHGMIRVVRDSPLGLVEGLLNPGEIRSCKAAKENWTSGGREGIRTLDLSVANAALSQLSYAPMLEFHYF